MGRCKNYVHNYLSNGLMHPPSQVGLSKTVALNQDSSWLDIEAHFYNPRHLRDMGRRVMA
jgi:hypothetical protein